MFDRRIRGLCIALFALLGLVVGRAFQLQVVEANELIRDHERSRSPFTIVVPRRGDILFADGTPMVANDSRYTVHVDLAEFEKPRFRCRECGDRGSGATPPDSCRECGAASFAMLPSPDPAALAEILGATRETIQASLLAAARAAKTNRWKSRRLLDAKISREAAQALALRADEFPGISVAAERVRVVEECAKRIVGRARPPWAQDVDRLAHIDREGRGLPVFTRGEARLLLVGASGLEGTYDEALRGVPGRIVRLHARYGEPRPEPLVEREVEDGATVRTTIERRVQEVAHEIVGGTRGTAAAAVVLDLRDGAVVALDSKSGDGLDHSLARLLPGSVLKLATAVAALETGADPAATVDCSRRGLLRPGVRYTCTGTHPGIDLRGAFAHSCNLYFMRRAEEAGGPALLDAYRRLGMFVETDLGPGRLPRSKVARTTPDELRFLGIGQGAVAMSPVHVAIMYARLATGGRTIVPYTDRDRGPDPASSEVDPVLRRHAPILLESARRVVESGTARGVAALRDLGASGKSGTAEVDLPRAKGEPPGPPVRTQNAWFVGFAPSEAPRYVAVVVHEHVEGHGGEVAGPDVARLLEAALR